MGWERSISAGRFLLDCGGEMAGFVKSVDGGQYKGEIATNNLGPHLYQKKHLATIKQEPITIEVGLGMGKPFWNWVQSSLDLQYTRMDGAIIAANFNHEAMARRDFFSALLTEFTIPALDASSKEPVYATIKFQPERTTVTAGDGNQVEGQIDVGQKKWLCSNFRITCGDLPCKRITKMDSITWKQGVVEDVVGELRTGNWEPAKVEIPNIKLTISMADWEPWHTWYQTFVVEGQCSDADELTMSVELLGPNMDEVLGTLELDHVGIITMQQEKVEANKDAVARFIVELYAEELTFKSA